MARVAPADVKKALIYVAFHLEDPALIEAYVEKVEAELLSRGIDVAVCRDLDSAKQEVKDADLMVCWRILPEIFENAGRLKWIQFGSAGIDHTIFAELLASDVVLTNLSGIHRVPITEHVVGVMLAMSRRIDVALIQQTRRVRDRSPFSSGAGELCGGTVGILGLGKIGLEIARVCKCLGMSVVGTKRTATPNLECVDKLYGPDQLDEVLKRSDYLVLVLPLTEESRCLLGERELGLMKPGARIVNVARGQMIDQDALIAALREGRLAGAALDVFAQEPLPSDSPLYDVPNVIITPHVAGSNRGYPERAFEIFRGNLEAFLAGRQMINVFDRARGY